MQILLHQSQAVKAVMVTALATLSLSSPALAEQPEAEQDKQENMSLIKADEDSDNMLTREEFKSFVAFETDAGKTDYAVIYEDGSEDLHFSGKDIDGDGLLTRDELSYNIILPEITVPENEIANSSAYGSGDAPKASDESPADKSETGGGD